MLFWLYLKDEVYWKTIKTEDVFTVKKMNDLKVDFL